MSGNNSETKSRVRRCDSVPLLRLVMCIQQWQVHYSWADSAGHKRATSPQHEANVTPNMYSALAGWLALWVAWLVAWNNEAETKNVSCERMRRKGGRKRNKAPGSRTISLWIEERRPVFNSSKNIDKCITTKGYNLHESSQKGEFGLNWSLLLISANVENFPTHKKYWQCNIGRILSNYRILFSTYIHK